MEYSTLESSGDDQQRTGEEVERKWHFIGRACVCHKGGSKHEHLSMDDFLSCNRANAKAERDLIEKRRQAELEINDKILQVKETELQVGIQQNINEERRSSNERQAIKMKHDHEIILKKLEMEQQAKSAKLEEKKIKVEENKANNMKDLLAILKRKKQSTNHGAIEDRQSVRPQIHIEPSTGSIEITTDNDAVSSALNRLLINN